MIMSVSSAGSCEPSARNTIRWPGVFAYVTPTACPQEVESARLPSRTERTSSWMDRSSALSRSPTWSVPAEASPVLAARRREAASVEKDRCMSSMLSAGSWSLTVVEAAMAPSDRRILNMATGQVAPSGGP